jgi:hypothetical protein
VSEAALYSLNEAAELTGLSVDALRQRIKRRKIHAVRGNDGLVRVRLDEAEIEALRTGRPPSRPPSQLAEQSSAISAWVYSNPRVSSSIPLLPFGFRLLVVRFFPHACGLVRGQATSGKERDSVRGLGRLRFQGSLCN